MNRSLKITLLVAALACLPACIGLQIGQFFLPDQVLWTRLGFMGRVPDPWMEAQLCAVIFLGFGVAWTTIDISKWAWKFLVLFLVVVELAAVVWLLAFYQVFFSPFASLLGVLVAFLGGCFYSVTATGERSRLVRQAFSGRLARKYLDAVCADRELGVFEGRAIEGTVVSIQLLNEGKLLEKLPPGSVQSEMNRFLAVASEILTDRGAFLDRVEGGGIRAVFGIPVREVNHAPVAAAAALEVIDKFKELNWECEGKWQCSLDYRVGVHGGEIVTGVFGAAGFSRFGTAGEVPEFAQRLACGNLHYGTRILVSSAVFGKIGEVMAFRPVELLKAGDEELPAEVYELLGEAKNLNESDLARRDQFWDGVVLFREQRFAEASAAFHSAKPEIGLDAAVEYYLNQIERRSVPQERETWESSRRITAI